MSTTGGVRGQKVPQGGDGGGGVVSDVVYKLQRRIRYALKAPKMSLFQKKVWLAELNRQMSEQIWSLSKSYLVFSSILPKYEHVI